MTQPARSKWGDRLLDAIDLHIVPEQEEPRERREVVTPVEPAQMNGRVDLPRRELMRSEPLLDPLGGEARPLQRDVQACERHPVAALGHIRSRAHDRHPATAAWLYC